MWKWTRSKITYTSSLQLHPYSLITYSSHHKCGIEAPPNLAIEFWVYDFWRTLSRARQWRGSLHYAEKTITKDRVFVSWIYNGNLFVTPFATRPLKSLLGRCSHFLLERFAFYSSLSNWSLFHFLLFICFIKKKLLINIKYWIVFFFIVVVILWLWKCKW